MLNRRSIRIKVMQSLFAYSLCKKANLNLAKDKVKSAFAPDLNSPEEQDKEELKKYEREALRLFQENYDSLTNENLSAEKSEKEYIPSLEAEVRAGVKFYEERNQADFFFFKNNLLIGSESIKDTYHKILKFILELTHQSKHSKSVLLSQNTNSSSNNFADNPFCKELETRLSELSKNINLDSEDNVTLKLWFSNVVKKDAEYRKFQEKEDVSLADSIEFFKYFTKNIIFKNQEILDYFEERDINWTENKSILRSMVLKTIKMIESNEPNEGLAELSMNWESDKQYMEKLFENAVLKEIEYENWIEKVSTNWSKSRINDLDLSLMKLAISEMLNFSNIPVKVTINEVVEIAKNYGTDKSKKFVNGLLDEIALSLEVEGILKKSGRGLMDNK